MAKNKKEKNRDYLDKNKYLRVFQLSKTPDLDEFLKVSKIVGISVIIVGLIGYLIFTLMGFIPF